MSITKKLFITTLLTLLSSIIAIEIFNLELFKNIFAVSGAILLLIMVKFLINPLIDPLKNFFLSKDTYRKFKVFLQYFFLYALLGAAIDMSGYFFSDSWPKDSYYDKFINNGDMNVIGYIGMMATIAVILVYVLKYFSMFLGHIFGGLNDSVNELKEMAPEMKSSLNNLINSKNKKPNNLSSKRTHSTQKKLSLVKMVADGFSIKEVAEKHDINPSLLRQWVKKYKINE